MFERWNQFTRRHEVGYDYFKCTSEEEAKAWTIWVYGDLIDILSVVEDL
jgi:hypothetical protein